MAEIMLQMIVYDETIVLFPNLWFWVLRFLVLLLPSLPSSLLLPPPPLIVLLLALLLVLLLVLLLALLLAPTPSTSPTSTSSYLYGRRLPA